MEANAVRDNRWKYYCPSAPSEHVGCVCVWPVRCYEKTPGMKNAESNDTTTNTHNDKIDLQLSSGKQKWKLFKIRGATVVCPTISRCNLHWQRAENIQLGSSSPTALSGLY